MKTKKVIIFVMVITLFVNQSLFAIDLGDMVNTAATKSSSWTSPMTGEKYFYSGSYEFTFNNTKSYTPWFNAGGSSDLFKVGCGGFSIGDMFMSMLGLSDIKDQLSGAGSQLAWGLMMGLVYSMPGIHEVFVSIQEWARAIQKLLQNACKIGQGLAKDLPFADTFKNFQSDLINSDIGQAIENSKTGILGKIKTITKGIDSLNCYEYKIGSPAYKSCKAKVSETTKDAVKKISKSTLGTSLFATTAGSVMSPPENVNGIYFSKLSTYLDEGTIGGLMFTANSKELSNLKYTILLERLFIGDTGIASISINRLLALTDCGSVSSIDGDKVCKPDLEKIKNETIQTVTGKEENYTAKESIIPAIISDPKQIAKSFLNGLTKESSTTDLCGKGYCYIKDNLVVYVNTPYSITTDGNSTSTVKILGNVISQNSKDDKLKVQWDGAITESYKSIKYYVKQASGITGNIGIYAKQPISSDSAGNIPLVVPGIGKYIDIIAKIEKKNKKETAFTASLEELLAKYNAYLFSKSFFAMMMGRVKSSFGDSITGVDAKKYADIEKSIATINDAVNKEFDTVIQQTNRFKTVVDIFKAIDENYRQSVSNNIN